MRRRLELTLTDFSRSALGNEALRYGLPVPTLITCAALYYLTERESDRLAARVPPFFRELSAGSDNYVLPVTIELRAQDWRAFEHRAASEESSVERLLEHAVLLFLGDLESGEAAARLLQSVDAEAD